MLFRSETDDRAVSYRKLQNLVDSPSMISITRDSWRQIETQWNKMEILVSVDRSLQFSLVTFGGE